MIQKKVECDQYTVMIGLMRVSESLLGEDVANMDLIAVKELLLNKLLNFNNHVRYVWSVSERANALESKRSITQRFADFLSLNRGESIERNGNNYPHCHVVPDLSPDEIPESDNFPNASSNLLSDPGKVELLSRKNGTVNTIKYLNRNEFFVYSASLSFNPKINSGSDLLNPSCGGGIVFTITAKMPINHSIRKIYLKMMVQYLGSDAVLLGVTGEALYLDSVLSNTKVTRDCSPQTSAVLKPIPKYFDEDYSDEDNDYKFNRQNCSAGTYSFFRHSSFLLSKYAKSNLVARDDDKYVNQRLLQVKMQRNKKNRC